MTPVGLTRIRHGGCGLQVEPELPTDEVAFEVLLRFTGDALALLAHLQPLTKHPGHHRASVRPKTT